MEDPGKGKAAVKSGGVKEGKIKKQKRKKGGRKGEKGDAATTSNNSGHGAVTDGNKDSQPARKSKKARKKEGLLKSGGQKKPGNRKQFGIKQVFASKYAPAFPSYDANLVSDVDIRGQIERALKRGFEQFDEDGQKAIVFGVNEVTKCLERKKLDLVVTCRDVSPMVLIAHLPALCYVSDVGMVIFQGRPQQLRSLLLEKWHDGKKARKVDAKTETESDTVTKTKNRVDIKTEVKVEVEGDTNNGAEKEMKTKTKAERPRMPPSSMLAFGILKNKLPELVKELQSVTVNLDFPWLAKLCDHEGNNDVAPESQRFNFPFPAPRMIPHRRKADRQQVTQDDCMTTSDLYVYRMMDGTGEAEGRRNEDGKGGIDGANNEDFKNKNKGKGKSKAKPKDIAKRVGDRSSTVPHDDDGDSIMKDV